MLKDVLEKALSSILVAAIIGLATLMYNEFETYKELRDLIDVRKELENSFINEVKDRKSIDNELAKRIQKMENRYKKDSFSIKYSREWVDYWVSLRK